MRGDTKSRLVVGDPFRRKRYINKARCALRNYELNKIKGVANFVKRGSLAKLLGVHLI